MKNFWKWFLVWFFGASVIIVVIGLLLGALHVSQLARYIIVAVLAIIIYPIGLFIIAKSKL
jgi:hypothetical protein